MLYIPCPYCGHRDETEFTYGGPSHVTRPELTASDREWTHYLYHRKNPKGPYRERWLHSFGCGQWFNVLRDTATHEILEIYLMGQSASPAQSPSIGQAASTGHPGSSGYAAPTGHTASTDYMAPTGHTASTGQPASSDHTAVPDQSASLSRPGHPDSPPASGPAGSAAQ